MVSAKEAEGFAELGLWQDAWDLLEELPAEKRSAPAVLRVRLACCPHLGGWELGKQIADLLRDGGEEDRRSAGRFFHALAIKCLAEGDRYSAREAMKAASKVWPDLRLLMLEDPKLSGLM